MIPADKAAMEALWNILAENTESCYDWAHCEIYFAGYQEAHGRQQQKIEMLKNAMQWARTFLKIVGKEHMALQTLYDALAKLDEMEGK